jgi:hypothetical protein
LVIKRWNVRAKRKEADNLALNSHSKDGRALSDVEKRLALAVGVQRPYRLRIKVVNQLPQPDHAELLAGLQAKY